MVGGFASIVMVDATGNYRWIAPIAFSLLMAYVLWYFWCKDYEKKIMIINALVFIGNGLLSYFYIEELAYVITGQLYELPAALWWVVLNAIVGIPAMVVALKVT
jgi:hypothetical protein